MSQDNGGDGDGGGGGGGGGDDNRDFKIQRRDGDKNVA